jgi:hypothetical protein
MYYLVDAGDNKNLRFAGSLMELAGLEPATSWVRSTCSSEREMACLQPVSGECLEYRNIPRNIGTAVLHYVNAEESPR